MCGLKKKLTEIVLGSTRSDPGWREHRWELCGSGAGGAWADDLSPGPFLEVHTVQFYDNEPFVHHAMAEFFTKGAHPGDRLILLSRPRTFKAVAEHLASGRYGSAINAADRILFFDAEAALPKIMEGEALNSALAKSFFKDMLSQNRPSGSHGTVRLYGEMVDMLCQRGHHTAALQLEGIGNVFLDLQPQLSILCGYATERFKDDTNAAQLRAVCQKHTHVIPAKGFSDALDDRTRHGSSVMLQHDALDRMLASPSAQPIYVIDDDASLRRSLKRLLTLSNRAVRTFESAEAFLLDLEKLSTSGCLIVDVELPGMSGLELVRRLTESGLLWPIVVMSASRDERSRKARRFA